LQSEQFRLSQASVQVTKAPAWVPESIVNDVLGELRSAGRGTEGEGREAGRSGPDRRPDPHPTPLTSHSALIDQKMLQELATAFQAYHWVESVDRVRASYPATVTIDLTYRTPVCLVMLPNRTEFYAVDRHGVLLASDYFMKNKERDINRYIQVFGVASPPMGSIGDRWDDIIVEHAAALADHLIPDNSILRIASIRAGAAQTADGRRRTADGRRTEFTLVTSLGMEIPWGEMPLTPDDSRKEELIKRVRQYGSLEKAFY